MEFIGYVFNLLINYYYTAEALRTAGRCVLGYTTQYYFLLLLLYLLLLLCYYYDKKIIKAITNNNNVDFYFPINELRSDRK
jgi:hypothetical protein